MKDEFKYFIENCDISIQNFMLNKSVKNLLDYEIYYEKKSDSEIKSSPYFRTLNLSDIELSEFDSIIVLDSETDDEKLKEVEERFIEKFFILLDKGSLDINFYTKLKIPLISESCDGGWNAIYLRKKDLPILLENL